MTRAAIVLSVAYGIYVVASVIAAVRRKRKLARVHAARIGGLEAFAASAGRSAEDAAVRATFTALVSERGTRLERVRAEDDLTGLYGIAEEDLDDVIEAAAVALHLEDRLPAYCRALRGQGTSRDVSTPARIIVFLEGLDSWSEPSTPE